MNVPMGMKPWYTSCVRHAMPNEGLEAVGALTLYIDARAFNCSCPCSLPQHMAGTLRVHWWNFTSGRQTSRAARRGHACGCSESAALIASRATTSTCLNINGALAVCAMGTRCAETIGSGMAGRRWENLCASTRRVCLCLRHLGRAPHA